MGHPYTDAHGCTSVYTMYIIHILYIYIIYDTMGKAKKKKKKMEKKQIIIMYSFIVYCACVSPCTCVVVEITKKKLVCGRRDHVSWWLLL
jgi:glycopeptide antibiotics resistance protein